MFRFREAESRKRTIEIVKVSELVGVGNVCVSRDAASGMRVDDYVTKLSRQLSTRLPRRTRSQFDVVVWVLRE